MVMTFPLSRYRFSGVVQRPLQLPEYAGSALRGSFGHALRTLACSTRAKTCDGCMLIHSCPYTTTFQPPKKQGGSLSLNTPPVPYILAPPPWGTQSLKSGQRLDFHFTLIGHSTRHLALIILAWKYALQHGLGTGMIGTADLETIHHCTDNGETLIWKGSSILDHSNFIALSDKPLRSPLRLNLATPLRLQENGSALPPSKITAKVLLMALVRRASILAEHYGSGKLFSPQEFIQMAEVAQEIKITHDLCWRDWTRHSSRQNRTMQLGGVIGRITLDGDLSLFINLLQLGQWLHVGKEASFGLGRYQIMSS